MSIKEDELFNNEFKILDKAFYNLSSEKYSQNEMLDEYRKLAVGYDKLLKLTKKVFRISDSQGKELKRRSGEIKDILDNSNQGFLTFGRDMLVNKEYSAECVRIFNRKINGCSIIELLGENGSEIEAILKNNFEKIFMSDKPEEISSVLQKLPSMLKVGESILNVKYKTISSDTSVENDAIMLILTDLTEKRKAEDQVLYLSYHDKLTSLFNRAYIESLTSQLQSDLNFPLSVIMADMNGLKLTNDVFGHEFGDKLLVKAAEVFMACTRKTDIVARWGGDEFLIILPATDRNGCQKVCNKILESCSRTEPNPIQLSAALGSATMDSPGTEFLKLFSSAENTMYRNKIAESCKVRRKIIKSIESILYTKCFEDVEHMKRMEGMADRFSGILGITADKPEKTILNMLVSFHDIGKVAIPEEILGKNSALTENEWEIVKSHPETGFRMAQSIDEAALAHAILAMREHWDGAGYPYGLKGDMIPYVSRIFSIIDAFDVMTHDRPYRPAISTDCAVNELERCRGTQFDPELADIFIKHLDKILE